MAFAKRSAAYSNGLDKKYDGDAAPNGQQWQPSIRMRPWTTVRKRRIFVAIVVVGLIYLFFKNIPTDVPSVGRRIDPLTGLSQARMPNSVSSTPQSKGPDAGINGEVYDGPVKFYELADTLRSHSHSLDTHGKENVVFVLYDLRSAASLTALACEMGLHNRTRVHMVLVCPQENAVSEIVAVAGIRPQDCPITWHDARPDHNSQSSLPRRITAIQIAIGHVHNYLKPVAVLIDEQQTKNSHVTATLRSRLDLSWTPLSVVPNNALTSMNWITTLDARSLSLLNQNQIDIVITPYRSSSGSLIRLLESIRSAHYHNLPLPRITVDIPPDVDSFALSYLEYFRWPSEVPISSNKLTLRRRLKRSTFSPPLASLHTLESFYPQTYPLSHVLVLDPDVELSPDYFSYLYYLALDYKYGSKGQNITDVLMGISLDVSPNPPTEQPKNSPLLLSQSSTNSATLYFGDRWIELQDYLSLRLDHDPDLTKTISTTATKSESKSPDSPAWLKPATELMRARNYYMLHPTFQGISSNTRLVTKHTESHQPPEEQFILPKPAIANNDSSIPAPITEPTILTSEGLYIPPRSSQHHARPDLSSNFLTQLFTDKRSDHAGLPIDQDIPMYDHTGTPTSWADSIIAANKFADQIKLQLGGCMILDDRDVTKEGVDALFCDVKG